MLTVSEKKLRYELHSAHLIEGLIWGKSHKGNNTTIQRLINMNKREEEVFICTVYNNNTHSNELPCPCKHDY